MVTLRSQRDTGKPMPPPDLAGLGFCKFMSYGLSWEKLVSSAHMMGKSSSISVMLRDTTGAYPLDLSAFLQVLPDNFGCTLMGRGLREVKLRVAGGGERRTWDVEVVPDEYGDVYLANGWREFARSNGLDLGQLLAFRYDGVALVTVTVLEGRPYQHDEEEAEDGAGTPRTKTDGNSSPPAPAPATKGSGNSSRSGAGRAEAGIDDDQASSRFSVTLRKGHFGEKQKQYMQVPKRFQDAQGYTDRTKAVVLQMRGKSWTVNLKHSWLSSGSTRIMFRYGWHQFLVDNGLQLGDTCFFRALEEDEDEENVLRVEVRKQDGTIVQ